METGLLLAFFLALVAGGCAGMGAVTDLGINTADVVAFAGAGSISFAREEVRGFLFFAGDFNPIVRFLRLGLVWLLFRCSVADGGSRNCCCCGFSRNCGSWSFW